MAVARCPGGQGSGTTVLLSGDRGSVVEILCSTSQCPADGELFSLVDFRGKKIFYPEMFSCLVCETYSMFVEGACVLTLDSCGRLGFGLSSRINFVWIESKQTNEKTQPPVTNR